MNRALFALGVLTTFACTLCVVQSAGLPSGAMLKDISTSGEGCDRSNTAVAITPDGGTLSILFSNYLASTKLPFTIFKRTTCDISIPVVVPSGYSLHTYKLEYRGFAFVPDYTSASLSVDYNFGVGSQPSKFSKEWVPSNNHGYTFMESDSLLGNATVGSACGKQTLLRLNTAIIAQAMGAATEDASIELDSVDITHGILIGLQWLPCTECTDVQAATCSKLASCGVGSDGKPICTCYDGLIGDGKTCVPRVPDKCTLTTNGGCQAPAVCQMGETDRICVCPDGYVANSTNGCTDVDECATGNGGCPIGSPCNNLPGTYSCGPCPAGTVLSGVSCVPKLLQLTWAGSGCNMSHSDAVTAEFAENNNMITISFNEFVLDSSTFPADQTKRSKCDVTIPVQVPPGYSVSTYTIDYRGYAAVPINSMGYLEAQFTFAGQAVPANSTTLFPPGMNAEYVTRYGLDAAVQVGVSECGQDVNLRLSTSIVGRHNSTDFDSDLYLSVATADVHQIKQTFGSNISLIWQRCPQCDVNTCGANSVCYQGKSGPKCACLDGYTPVGNTCVDINECANNNGGCLHNRQCVNFPGSFKCRCPVGQGYRLDEKGDCVDIDECAEGTAQCSTKPAVTCINTLGGYTCGPCPAHFNGDGKVCTQVTCGLTYPGPAEAYMYTSVVLNTVPQRADLKCAPGYAMNNTQGVTSAVSLCQDDGTWQPWQCVAVVNPCKTSNGLCGTNRPCYWNGTMKTCGPCDPGYAANALFGGRGNCQDINECLTNNGNCPKGLVCKNLVGSYVCQGCPTGYNADASGNCVPVSCGVPSAVTNAQASCVLDSQGNPAYTFNASCVLSCAAGYVLNGPSSITCQLSGSAGRWSTAGNCEDVNECATANGGCDPNADCSNLSGGFTCACKSGFLEADQQPGKYCTEINACATDNGGCSQIPLVSCQSSRGVAICGACPSGFSGDGKTCVDVNECAVSNGGCWGVDSCINFNGSYMCAPCPPGYDQSVAPQGQQVCTDIDECKTGAGQCDALTKCVNVKGSYNCTACPAGYVDGLPVQGRQCVAVNMISIGSATAAGTGCKQDTTKFSIIGVAPNTWKLGINFTTPLGMTPATSTISNKACSIRVFFTFNSDLAGQPFSTGGMTYYARGSITSAATTIRLGYDSFWSGQLSTPTSISFNGPVSGPLTKKDSSVHPMTVPAAGVQTFFAINANVNVQKAVKGDTFLVDYMESDTFVALLNYTP